MKRLILFFVCIFTSLSANYSPATKEAIKNHNSSAALANLRVLFSHFPKITIQKILDVIALYEDIDDDRKEDVADLFEQKGTSFELLMNKIEKELRSSNVYSSLINVIDDGGSDTAILEAYSLLNAEHKSLGKAVIRFFAGKTLEQLQSQQRAISLALRELFPKLSALEKEGRDFLLHPCKTEDGVQLSLLGYILDQSGMVEEHDRFFTLSLRLSEMQEIMPYCKLLRTEQDVKMCIKKLNSLMLQELVEIISIAYKGQFNYLLELATKVFVIKFGAEPQVLSDVGLNDDVLNYMIDCLMLSSKEFERYCQVSHCVKIKAQCTAVSVAPDGKSLCCFNGASYCAIYDLLGKSISSFQFPSNLYAVQNWNGETFTALSAMGIQKVNPRTKEITKLFTQTISGPKIASDSQKIAITSGGTDLIVYDSATHNCLLYKAASTIARKGDFKIFGGKCFDSYANGSVKIWNHEGIENTLTGLNQNNRLLGSIDDRLFVWNSDEEVLQQWDIKALKVISELSFEGKVPLTINSDGTRILFATPTGIELYDVETGDLLSQVTDGFESNLAIFDKSYCATVHKNKICLRDLYSLEPICILNGHTTDLQSMSFTEDERHLISTDLGGTVCIWDIAKALQEAAENSTRTYEELFLFAASDLANDATMKVLFE